MISLGRKGHTLSIIVDGPKGPAGVSKIGVVLLAKETGFPIVPVDTVVENGIDLNNWDQTAIPYPGSRIVTKYGTPIFVPSQATREECENIRRELDEALVKMKKELHAYLKRTRV